MAEDKYGLETQNMVGLRYQAFKAGIDHSGMSRERLISILRNLREQSGTPYGPVNRIPTWLREKRSRDRHARF